jgi:hypothetical protein
MQIWLGKQKEFLSQTDRHLIGEDADHPFASLREDARQAEQRILIELDPNAVKVIEPGQENEPDAELLNETDEQDPDRYK